MKDADQTGWLNELSVPLPFWEIGGFGPHGFEAKKSLAISFFRIVKRLVDAVSGKCDWVGYQVMMPTTWSPSGAAL